MCEPIRETANLQKFENFLAAQTALSSAYGEKNINVTTLASSVGAWVSAEPYLFQGTVAIGSCLWNELVPYGSSAFTSFQAENGLEMLVKKIRALTTLIRKENVYNRILELMNLLQEEENIINSDSLYSFYRFFNLNRKLNLPSISLTPDNEIYSSWEINENQLFDLHFLGQDNVKFVLFVPSKEKPENIIRLSGITKADSVINEVAKPFGIISWISE
jgi:hypothetical protein